MNPFATSPTMVRSVARYAHTEPAAQAKARAARRAIRAEKRQARTTWNPFTALTKWFAVPTSTGTPAHSR